jgi:hypothetical protein
MVVYLVSGERIAVLALVVSVLVRWRSQVAEDQVVETMGEIDPTRCSSSSRGWL